MVMLQMSNEAMDVEDVGEGLKRGVGIGKIFAQMFALIYLDADPSEWKNIFNLTPPVEHELRKIFEPTYVIYSTSDRSDRVAAFEVMLRNIGKFNVQNFDQKSAVEAFSEKPSPSSIAQLLAQAEVLRREYSKIMGRLPSPQGVPPSPQFGGPPLASQFSPEGGLLSSIPQAIVYPSRATMVPEGSTFPQAVQSSPGTPLGPVAALTMGGYARRPRHSGQPRDLKTRELLYEDNLDDILRRRATRLVEKREGDKKLRCEEGSFIRRRNQQSTKTKRSGFAPSNGTLASAFLNIFPSPL